MGNKLQSVSALAFRLHRSSMGAKYFRIPEGYFDRPQSHNRTGVLELL